MDSFGLRQEQSELLKSVSELKHKLEIGEKRVKELHDEEMRYLQEIPVYKKQAENESAKLKEVSNLVVSVSIELEKLNNQVKENNSSLDKSKSDMNELSINSQIILDSIQKEKDDSRRRSLEVKNSEIAVQEREVNCVSRETFHKKIESDLDKRESDLSKLENEFKDKAGKLTDDILVHQGKVEEHGKNLESLAERKKFHSEDEELLKNKLAKADKLIKDQIELKSGLILQSEKLDKEISITKAKQDSLDRHIADLVNQENALKIKELKIRKMAHDAGLVKELAELSK